MGFVVVGFGVGFIVWSKVYFFMMDWFELLEIFVIFGVVFLGIMFIVVIVFCIFFNDFIVGGLNVCGEKVVGIYNYKMVDLMVDLDIKRVDLDIEMGNLEDYGIWDLDNCGVLDLDNFDVWDLDSK